MSQLPDILNGERYVLPVDDILVARTYYAGVALRDVELGLTSNSAISQFVRAGLSSNLLAAYTVVAPELIATGRLFLSNRDVGVTFTLSDNGISGAAPHLETTLLTKTAGSTEFLPQAKVQTIPMAVLTPRAIAVADFTGDGLDDVVFHAGSYEGSTGGSSTIIATANNVSNPSEGLRVGPEHVRGPGPAYSPAYLDVKAGDLNGDGRAELIGLKVQDDPFRGFRLHVVVHTVDPTTLETLDPPGNDYVVPGYMIGDHARLAVGKFDDDMGDNEIVVVHGGSTCTSGTGAYCSVRVTPIKVNIAPPPPTGTGAVSFAGGVTVDIGPYLNGSTGSPWDEFVGLEVATGKLNWFGGNPRDQIVVATGMTSDYHYKGYAAVVVDFVTSTDPTTGSTNPMSISTDQVKASAYNNKAAPTTCLLHVAVGRFSPPPPPDPMGTSTNSQVALLLGGLSSGDSQHTDCSKDAWNTVSYTSTSIGIYTVDPTNNYKITSASSTTLPPTSGNTFAPPRMAVGDFQGRSLRLGAPTIVKVAQQIQPRFVIGAPPMHIDYFTPPLYTERYACYASSLKEPGQEPMSGTGTGVRAACIQNVSAYPGQQATASGGIACDYCARFSTSTDASKAGYQETTTSHTWSNEGGGSVSITYGKMKPTGFTNGGVQLEAHGSAKRMHSNTNTTRDETLKREAIKLDTATGPDDYVLFTTQDVYLYMYPVIDQFDTDGNPIYLHFSVPDQTQYLESDAASLPWYQPPHEVGNIFSYPGNRDQLVNDYPGAADRSGAFTWSSGVALTRSVTWTENQSEAKTAGSVDRTDWNVGTSVTGVFQFYPGLQVKGNAYYDHNESTANQYTNTNKKTLDKSEGFSVTTPVFSYPQSGYLVTARILGTETPTLDSGYWDAPVPMPDPQGKAGENFVPDLTLDGPMQLVYSTDMISTSPYLPGTLWRAVYGTLPDIALQHHRRVHWVQRTSGVPLSDVWNFVPLSSNIDLHTLYLADNLKMKGFFISPATALEGSGPQMTMATEGQQLRLAARVYNYSLVGLPPGATVKVRFYAHQQDQDDSGHYDLWKPGGCTLIGEASISDTNIGGFSVDPNAKTATNRAMAHTIFDTTGRGGQHLIFWVVAWAENADGTKVQELEQHGLTSEPPAGCPANSILDMPMEFYSNNVGYYEQPFFIMPKALAAAAPKAFAAAPKPAADGLRPFSIGALTVSPVHAEQPYAGALWQLEAPLQAGGQDALSVHLVHAGQGPGGRVSNTGMIPFIEAGQTYADRLTFRPLWCGPHTALVTARPAFRDPVSATLEFEIACRPEDVTAFFNDVLTDATLAGIVSVNKNGQVEGWLAALQTAVLTAERLANTGATRGACQQYAQALARVADAGNGPVAHLLEDIIRNAREQLGCR